MSVEDQARTDVTDQEGNSEGGAMSEEELLGFARRFDLYYEWMAHLARSSEKPSRLRRRFDAHLGNEASGLPIFSEQFPGWDHVNLMHALDIYGDSDDRSLSVGGVAGATKWSLSDLIASKLRSNLDTGPLDFVNLPTGPDRIEPCVRNGVFFLTDGDLKTVMWVRGPDSTCGREDSIVQLVSNDRDGGQALMEGIRATMVEHNLFRGQVVSFGQSPLSYAGAAPISFISRPAIDRDRVILPEGILETLERQVFGIAEHRDRLRAAGQHLKRGVLLHGPPGTGKTHTVRHLMARATEHTIVVLTGDSLRLIGHACALARALEPSIVIVEDVDLVAGHRGSTGSTNPVLFEMLNQLDGIADDADIVFLLTTNRADLLEPALAARPGRVDLALEVPLPGPDERRRLLSLYAGDAMGPGGVSESLIQRMHGVTASFVKEVVRKAALYAAIELEDGHGTEPQVNEQSLQEALDELLDDRNSLTRILLGEQREGHEGGRSSAGWL